MATPEFEQAHDWATWMLIAGDPRRAAEVWQPPDSRTQEIALSLAGGWIKAVLDLADALGVEPGTLWEQARSGPLKPEVQQ